MSSNFTAMDVHGGLSWRVLGGCVTDMLMRREEPDALFGAIQAKSVS